MSKKGAYQISTRSRKDLSPITENTPLTPIEYQFIQEYIKTGNLTTAVAKLPGCENRTRTNCSYLGTRLLQRPNVQAEITRIMESIQKDTIATADEVMQYFSSVMRGEVKDQFGLEAPLSERTKAAQELAKRTVDILNRQNGVADQKVEIKLDWSR